MVLYGYNVGGSAARSVQRARRRHGGGGAAGPHVHNTTDIDE